jgi:hypothetical protein
MRRVSSRQRLVSWDAFDATAGSDSEKANGSSFVSYHDDFDEEFYISGYETSQSKAFHLSTTLDGLVGEENIETLKNKALDRKGSKVWMRRRKRDRKSTRSRGTERANMCKNVENPENFPAVTSTTEGVPTIVPSFSWEIGKSSPSKLVRFDNLIDDLHLGIFSFLDLSSLRSVMSVSRRYRNLMASGDARSGVWMDHCERVWRIKPKNHNGPPLNFVDNFDLPIAATTFGSDDMGKKSDTNLSFLLSLAPTTFPTSVDKKSLTPRRRLRRDIQQTIPAYRLEEEDELIRCYQDSSTGQSIVRYTGYVGQGDRCIRSNNPLPKPRRPILKSTGYTNGAAFLGSNRHNMSYRPTLFEMIRSSSKSMIRDNSRFVTSSSTLQLSSDWIPFVVPFVDQSIDGRTTTANVTPRFVSYFEVNILNLEDHDISNDMESPDDGSPTARRSPNYRTSYKDCVAVGVATRSFQFQSRMPGWDQQSYGYHGDDGGIFHSSGGMLEQFGPKFGPGDTIGCGIDYISKGIFYTLNGEFLGYAWERISDEILQKDLFPVVGIDTNSPIHMNFGSVDSGPFQFNLSNFIKKHEKQISLMYSLDAFCGLDNTSTVATKVTSEVSTKKTTSLCSSRRHKRGLVGRRSQREP